MAVAGRKESKTSGLFDPGMWCRMTCIVEPTCGGCCVVLP